MSACGGGTTLSKKDLQTQAGAVESFAAEGALVAQGVQEDRTTTTLVRVHTEYMVKALAKVDSALSSKHASGGLEDKRVRAAKLAYLVSQDLDELHRAPGDRAMAARIRSDLEKHAVTAGDLAK
jgi:hypothetical protein